MVNPVSYVKMHNLHELWINEKNTDKKKCLQVKTYIDTALRRTKESLLSANAADCCKTMYDPKEGAASDILYSDFQTLFSF